jgi:hypothetical protein
MQSSVRPSPQLAAVAHGQPMSGPGLFQIIPELG